MKTQTSEFDYLFKGTAKQEPFTEAYFRSDDDKVKFYTGLPGFDIMMTTFNYQKISIIMLISRVYYGPHETEALCAPPRSCLQI